MCFMINYNLYNKLDYKSFFISYVLRYSCPHLLRGIHYCHLALNQGSRLLYRIFSVSWVNARGYVKNEITQGAGRKHLTQIYGDKYLYGLAPVNIPYLLFLYSWCRSQHNGGKQRGYRYLHFLCHFNNVGRVENKGGIGYVAVKLPCACELKCGGVGSRCLDSARVF